MPLASINAVYAFNLVLKKTGRSLCLAVDGQIRENGIGYRCGSAGGSNQIRQLYLKGLIPEGHHRDFPEAEHIHFYGSYISNFTDLYDEEINALYAILNAVE